MLQKPKKLYDKEQAWSSRKVLLKLEFFHAALYYCVRYSNIEYQDEIIKFITQKVMAKYSIGCRFCDFKYFEVDFFSYSLNSL